MTVHLVHSEDLRFVMLTNVLIRQETEMFLRGRVPGLLKIFVLMLGSPVGVTILLCGGDGCGILLLVLTERLSGERASTGCLTTSGTAETDFLKFKGLNYKFTLMTCPIVYAWHQYLFSPGLRDGRGICFKGKRGTTLTGSRAFKIICSP